MRRLFPMLLLLLLAACGGPKSDGVQLNVFAAASLQEPLSEIGAAYEQAHPGVALVFHFDHGKRDPPVSQYRQKGCPHKQDISEDHKGIQVFLQM